MSQIPEWPLFPAIEFLMDLLNVTGHAAAALGAEQEFNFRILLLLVGYTVEKSLMFGNLLVQLMHTNEVGLELPTQVSYLYWETSRLVSPIHTIN